MYHTKAILLITLQAMVLIAAGQRTDTAGSTINLQLTNNQANFSSALRPLRQIAGAPEAFYSYYWEFGDGRFSFEENPRHVYRDTGLFNARLYATNNYDDGKPPPLKPKPVRVRSKSNQYVADNNPSFFKKGGAIEMRVNCMPKPDEDMILIVGYRNEADAVAMNGSMVLFYNEKQFRKNNFDLSEERIYNNEQKSSLSSITAFVPNNDEMIRAGSLAGPNSGLTDEERNYYDRKLAELLFSKQKIFRQNQTWRFTNLEKGDEKYFFITLHTTPEMIKDTNTTVELSAMFIPDNPSGSIEEYTLELQIVASHDPNRMMLRNRRLNYRFTGKKKEMTYTVRFQNTGKGPATQISAGISVPSMLDARSIEILDYYPRTIFCNTGASAGQSCLDTIVHKDSIHFIFRNIYLPGLRQQGFSDPDSTMGFVKYRMHFNKELKKLPFASNASIVFDNNKPIYTNSPIGYFKPGRSYAIIAGYNFFLGEFMEDEKYFSIGGSVSPYSPYRKYLQEELYLGYMHFPEELIAGRPENKDTIINSVTYHIYARDIYAKTAIIKLDIVPLQLRYNIMNWIGAGIGSILSFNGYTRFNNREKIFMQQPPNPGQIVMEKTYPTSKWFTNFDVAAFADIQLGRVRVGPVVGVRFMHYFRFPRNGLYVYAAWRL